MKLPVRLSMLLIIVLALWGNVQVSAQNPALVSPPNNSVCVPPAIHLAWNTIANHSTFTLMIANNADFSEMFFAQAGITDLFYDIYTLDFGTKYYWKVIAKNDNDTTTVHSPVWAFTTRQGPIKLAEPDSNSFCVSVNHTLIWRKAESALNYRLEVSSTPFFNAQTTDFFDNLSDTTFTLSNLNSNTRYWWRVRGNFTGCEGYWSEAWTFRTKPVSVELISPANNTKGLPIFASGFPYNFEIKWHSVPDAHFYDIQLVDDAVPANVLVEQFGLNDTVFTITDILPNMLNKAYQWRVRAMVVNDSVHCPLDWSNWFTIRTPYDKALLSEPLNNAECVEFENPFLWHPVVGASAYDVHLSSKADFTDTLHFASNLTDTLVVFPMARELSVYYWRVRANDANNIGNWSNPFQFKTSIKAPKDLNPLNNATAVPLTVYYIWQDKGENARYRIQISDTYDFSNILVDAENLTERTFTYTHNLNSKLYYWRLKVKLDGCESEWSQDYIFKTLLPAPQLLEPANLADEVSNTPTFKWAAVATAQFYEMHLDTAANFNTAIIRQNIPASEIKPANVLLEDKKYYWKVRAINQEGAGAWSSVFSFTTKYIPPAAPRNISPANEAKKQPISGLKIIWSKVANADSYHLQVTRLISFTNLVLDTLNLSDTSFTISGLNNYVTYQFRVRAANQGGFSEWSEPFAFRTINVVPSTPPDLTTPAHTAINEQVNLRLSWLAANHAEGYHLQVSKNEAFTDLQLEEVSLYVPYHNIYNLANNTRYYWRVRAWNEAGIGPWSEVRYFNTIPLSSVKEELLRKYEVAIYPNPAQSISALNFNLSEASNVAFSLYNSIGTELIAADYLLNAGANSIKIDAGSIPNGIYIWKLIINNEVLTGKLNVVR